MGSNPLGPEKHLSIGFFLKSVLFLFHFCVLRFISNPTLKGVQMDNSIYKALIEPFSYEDLEFRIQTYVEDQKTAKILTYVDARAVQNRLDEVFGWENWFDNYTETNNSRENGMKCDLTVVYNDRLVKKTGFAPYTAVEPLKGGESDALKRAAVKFGIGRYLYNLTTNKVNLIQGYGKSDKTFKAKSGKWYSWKTPILPDWALPLGENKTTTKGLEDDEPFGI